ncbi:MAG TPA: class I SAM-dependent methyltransferase, partial [Longimicrobiales bacterium]
MTSLPSGTARPEREHIAEFEDMYAAGREPFDYTLRAVEWLRHELVADTALRLAPRRVLDLGCGLGQISRRLVAPGRQVVATDLSATAVARACRLFPDTAAAFLAGSALDLPFREAAFDVVVASDGLVSWHLNREQRATALGEIRRVLRPGGTALLTEYIRGHQFDEFVAEVVTAGLR